MYTLGIDLGGTNIAVGVVNDNGEIVGRAGCKTNAPRDVESILDDMACMCREAVKAAELTMEDIAYTGIGSPGTCNTVTGEVERADNLGFVHLMLGDGIQQRLGIPAYLENDANAAAMGEYIAGAGRGSESCICVTLGTGVGGGVIVNGTIYSGHNFAGAELGHTVIAVDGERCACGRHGCWEAYASATALIRQTRRAMEQHPESVMWKLTESIDKVNGLTAFDAMRAGDAVGTAVVDTYIRYVAIGVTNMINVFQPEVLCIGGGICKEGDTLLAPIRKIVEAERYSRYSERQTRICAAKLGNDAGIIGAAFLRR